MVNRKEITRFRVRGLNSRFSRRSLVPTIRVSLWLGLVRDKAADSPLRALTHA